MSDAEWYKKFNAMPISGDCDSNCGKPAIRWFGRTNQATCGDKVCVDQRQAEYDSYVCKSIDEDD